MANINEEYNVHFRGKDDLSKVLDDVNAKADALQERINKFNSPELRQSNQRLTELKKTARELGISANTSAKQFAKFTSAVAVGTVVSNATALAYSALRQTLKAVFIDSTALAARIQVLNHVMEFTGENAGYTSVALSKMKFQIMALGITEKETLTIMQRFIQANLDLADSTKIARIAQDAAVIAGVNSSEAALGITDAINKLFPRLLKQYGIIVDLNETNRQMAKSLGKTATSLTTAEKRQGLMNAVMEQGARIAGAYEKAMEDVGKQVTSLPRLFEDAGKSLGESFLPEFERGTSTLSQFLIWVRETFETTDDALNRTVAAFDKKLKDTDIVKEQIKLYEDLQKTTNRTSEENKLLLITQERLIRMFPQAAEGWGKNTRAMSLNLSLLKQLNAESSGGIYIKSFDELVKAAERYKEAQEEILDIREGLEIGIYSNNIPNFLGLGSMFSEERALDDLRDLYGELKNLEIAMANFQNTVGNAKPDTPDFLGALLPYRDAEFINILSTDLERIKKEVEAVVKDRGQLTIDMPDESLWDLDGIEDEANDFVDVEYIIQSKWEEYLDLIQERYQNTLDANSELRTMRLKLLTEEEQFVAKMNEERDQIIDMINNSTVDAPTKALRVQEVNEGYKRLTEEGLKEFERKLKTDLVAGFQNASNAAIQFYDIVSSGNKFNLRSILSMLNAVTSLTKSFQQMGIFGGGGVGKDATHTGLAALSGPALLGVSVGASLLGSLFDDPINDSILKRESRRVASLVSRGLSESVGSPNRSRENNGGGRTFVIENISINPTGTFNAKQFVEELEELSSNGFTFIR